MIRVSRIAVAAATLSLVAGAAVAQTSFTPPLSSPTPIGEPIYVELQPGARTDCVMNMTMDDPNLPPMPSMQSSTAVEAANGGVRVLISETATPSTATFFLGDDGSVEFDGSTFDNLQLPEATKQQLRDSMQDLLKRNVLHRRTLAQGEVFLEAEDLQNLFGAITSALPPGFSIDISGGSVVAGETVSNGRRSIVFDTELNMVMTFDNAGQTISMTMVAEGNDVMDVETGLQRYSNYRMVMNLPPDPSIPNPEIGMTMEIACELTAAQ